MGDEDAETQDVRIHVKSNSNSSGTKKDKQSKMSTDKKKSHGKKRLRNAETEPKLSPEDDSKPSSEPVDRTTSFRHLFSFGANPKVDDKSEQEDLHKKEDHAPFSLLGTADEPPFEEEDPALAELIGDGEKEEDPASRNTMEVEGAHRIKTEEWEHERGVHAIENGNKHEWADYRMPSNQKQQNTYQNDRNGGVQNDQSFDIPEDIDGNSEAILLIARQFCRGDVSMDDLETQWCKPEGIRELMRADFRQKRRSRISGRKLGAGPPKRKH